VAAGKRFGGFRFGFHDGKDLVVGDFVHCAAVAAPAPELLNDLNTDRRWFALWQIRLQRGIDSQQVAGINALAHDEPSLHVLAHEPQRRNVAAKLVVRSEVQVPADFPLYAA
jgi:hypothetical protein